MRSLWTHIHLQSAAAFSFIFSIELCISSRSSCLLIDRHFTKHGKHNAIRSFICGYIYGVCIHTVYIFKCLSQLLTAVSVVLLKLFIYLESIGTKQYSDPNNSPWECPWSKGPRHGQKAGQAVSLFPGLSDLATPTVITHTLQFTCQGQVPKVICILRLLQCRPKPNWAATVESSPQLLFNLTFPMQASQSHINMYGVVLSSAHIGLKAAVFQLLFQR